MRETKILRPAGPKRSYVSASAVEVALLDRAGVIVNVNQAWRDFGTENGGDPSRTGVGMSYLAACEAAVDDPVSARVAAAVKEAVRGDRPAPAAIRMACDSPTDGRWLDVLISSRHDDAGVCLGAAVTLSAAASVGTAAESSAEMVDRLTSRTQQLLLTKSRLRSLLRANAAVVSDLSLPAVLGHIVEAAQELVQARYAALGVLDGDRGPEQFVQVDGDVDLVSRISALPYGSEALSLLRTSAQPVRLSDLGTPAAADRVLVDPPSTGGFLGVPIRVRDQTYGNLYLAGSANGCFSREDEELVTALAANAGVAIANARLYAENVQQRSWLAATTTLTQQLFAHSSERPVEVVLGFALREADADMACLAVPLSATQATVQAALGDGVAITGTVVELANSMAGRVILSGRAALVNDWAAEFGAQDMSGVSSQVGSAIGVPLPAGAEGVLGALLVGRRPGRPVFTATEMQSLAGFASHAGLALQLDRARVEDEAASTMADHDRIAADLHDHVIQALFATGMGMEGMINGLADARQRERMSGYVDSLDATIRQIRNAVFEVELTRPEGVGLRQRLLSILADERAALGFQAGIKFVGPFDLTVPSRLADDLVAVVREALSNTARHAHASRVEITVALAEDLLTLTVIDNGCGVGTPARSSGLSNMRRRAAAHDGALVLAVPDGGGTHLRWTGRVSLQHI